MKYNKKLNTNNFQLIAGGMRKSSNIGPSLLRLNQIHISSSDQGCHCFDSNYNQISGFKSWGGTGLSFCKEICCNTFFGVHGMHEGKYFKCRSNTRDLLEGDTKPFSPNKKSLFGCC
jgi:hypothetical protein